MAEKLPCCGMAHHGGAGGEACCNVGHCSTPTVALSCVAVATAPLGTVGRFGGCDGPGVGTPPPSKANRFSAPSVSDAGDEDCGTEACACCPGAGAAFGVGAGFEDAADGVTGIAVNADEVAGAAGRDEDAFVATVDALETGGHAVSTNPLRLLLPLLLPEAV
mmetsp:Transcript_31410/g.56937  ORF Transcript_31410/g.56937 Transcript_31410/m.56937 type:complete len:163 (+) Transcript_31410:399-887(+)